MRDISLHLLDLIENSIRAGATVVKVSVVEDPARDLMEVSIEDDGAGLHVPSDVATDPFYTTKAGKRIGLGLSLFRSTAEKAGGSLTIGQSALGGALVKATMSLSHVDRLPLGDLAATLSSVVCTNPALELACELRCRSRECVVRASDLRRELPQGERCGLSVARMVAERVREGLASIEAVG